MCLTYQKFVTFLGLSFLQNGAIPKFLGEERLNEIFVKKQPSNCCYTKVRSGFKAVGVYYVSKSFFSRTFYIFSLY